MQKNPLNKQHKHMFRRMNKKITTIYAQNFCLSAPIILVCFLYPKDAKLFACWEALHVFYLPLLIFFQNSLFRNKRFRNTNRVICQKVWIQIRPNILSALIWDQTVHKGYQQQRVNFIILYGGRRIIFVFVKIIMA